MSALEDSALEPGVSIALLEPGEMGALRDDWHALADRALEPNPFFERWFMEPALELFGTKAVRFLTVSVRGVLALLVPVLQTRGVRGLPLKALTTFRHDYDRLGTPLVHRDHARAALGALLDGLAGTGATLAMFSDVRGDGPFRAALLDATSERRTPVFIAEAHTRAVFHPDETAEAFMARAFSANQRKDLRRRERRLAEAGPVEFGVDRAPTDAERFAEDFLRVEASGWKGAEGTAFASRPGHRRFFEKVVRGAAAEGKLEGLWLHVGGETAAMFCALRGGQELFAWKVAYDERFAKAAPGWLLEVENIRRLHEPGHRWEMDSCSTHDNELANRAWPDRLVLETVVLPATPAARFVVASMPLLQWGKRQLWGRVPRKAP